MVSVEQVREIDFQISYPSTSLIAIKGLNRAGKVIRDYDPLLGAPEIERFGAKPVASLQGFEGSVDCIIVNSPHGVFVGLTLERMLAICNGKLILVDVTGMLRRNDGVQEGCVLYTMTGGNSHINHQHSLVVLIFTRHLWSISYADGYNLDKYIIR